MTEADAERLVQDFQETTLPRSQWTHAAHLVVSLWYRRRFSGEETLHQMRQSIQAYNAACDVPTTMHSGYHETVTGFFVRIVGYYWERSDQTQTTEALIQGLLQEYGDRNHIFQYYSRRRLLSPAARLEWLKPDRRPLE